MKTVFVFTAVLVAMFMYGGFGVSPRSFAHVATPIFSQFHSQSTHLDDVVSVVRVVDGDTIVVGTGGTEEKVRLIGIDTPETVDPRKPVQCFGKEASDEAKRLMTGGQVKLVSDTTQSDRDTYGRLLRYVYLQDGTFVNKKMIEEGFAYEYTYHVPYQFQTEFKSAQALAQKEKRGLWADGVCEEKL